MGDTLTVALCIAIAVLWLFLVWLEVIRHERLRQRRAEPYRFWGRLTASGILGRSVDTDFVQKVEGGLIYECFGDHLIADAWSEDAQKLISHSSAEQTCNKPGCGL